MRSSLNKNDELSSKDFSELKVCPSSSTTFQCQGELLLSFEESFTFKIRADERETAVKVTFLLNEIFQSSLIIDLENEQIAGRCELLQIQTVQRLRPTDRSNTRQSQSSVQCSSLLGLSTTRLF